MSIINIMIHEPGPGHSFNLRFVHIFHLEPLSRCFFQVKRTIMINSTIITGTDASDS